MKTQKIETKGFGASANFNSAKFEVRFTENEVEIVQVLGIDQDFKEATCVKVRNEIFSPFKTAIADYFNLRLKDKGIKKGKWEKVTYLDNLLGKELAVLFWAMNQAKDKNEEDAIFNSWQSSQPSTNWFYFLEVAREGKAVWNKESDKKIGLYFMMK